MGIIPIFRKEIGDHLGSRRFVILMVLIVLASVSATYVAAQSIQADLTQHPDQSFVFLRLFTASNGSLPGFASFVAFLGPLLGVAFGFDAINSEQSRGTLGRLLSQPIYRDNVINGKFLAGLATISVSLLAIYLLVSGLGLRMIGVPPSEEEIVRLAIFFVISVFYVGFWLALSTLFSLLTRQAATSALGALSVWLFMAIFVTIVSGLVASAFFPTHDNSPVQQVLDNRTLQQNIARVSPSNLYEEATEAILSPDVRTITPVLFSQAQGAVPGSLKLDQSLLLVWPDVTGVIALTVVCFGVAYAMFMRQEIRTL